MSCVGLTALSHTHDCSAHRQRRSISHSALLQRELMCMFTSSIPSIPPARSRLLVRCSPVERTDRSIDGSNRTSSPAAAGGGASGKLMRRAAASAHPPSPPALLSQRPSSFHARIVVQPRRHSAPRRSQRVELLVAALTVAAMLKRPLPQILEPLVAVVTVAALRLRTTVAARRSIAAAAATNARPLPLLLSTRPQQQRARLACALFPLLMPRTATSVRPRNVAYSGRRVCSVCGPHSGSLTAVHTLRHVSVPAPPAKLLGKRPQRRRLFRPGYVGRVEPTYATLVRRPRPVNTAEEVVAATSWGRPWRLPGAAGDSVRRRVGADSARRGTADDDEAGDDEAGNVAA